MLKKLFIKDYANTDNVEVRKRYGTVAGMFGILSNIFLFVVKLIIGLASNSITVIADAVNNLSDSGSAVLTIFGFRISGKPADKEHPYGHARFEQVTALIVTMIVLCIGVLFAKSSFEKIITPEEITVNFVTYLILVVAIVVKFLQMLVYLDFAKSIDSDTLRAQALDSRNDLVSTSGVLLSIIIMDIFSLNLDGWVGLIISVFLIVSSVKSLKETIDPMLGIPPTKELVDSIISLVTDNDKILGYHDLIIHNYGVGANFASIHLEIDAADDIIAVHDIIDNMEHLAFNRLGIMLTVHMDPVDISNPKRAVLLEICKNTLSKYDSRLSMHDFRIVDGPTHTNILFDIVEPYGIAFNLDDLKAALDNALSEQDGKFFYVINVDRAMTDEA